jgi:two-component system, chemotaxis family, CheB/CheR fusion protein
LHKTLRPAVRAAVNQTLADGVRVVNDNLTMRIDGQARALTLIVEPIGGENGAKSTAACVVAFRDTSPAAAPAVTATSRGGDDANVAALEKELLATRAQLRAAVDELETRIEDMKSTTEESQSVNEELRSANEELETSKEEMQSVNEELQTINGELNSKNEQLTRLNADMQNLLDSTQIATIFLDEELRIRHFTPALTQLFPVQDSDRGRPLTQIVSDVDYAMLRTDVAKVQQVGEVLERDVVLKNHSRHFVMRIRPYRTPQNVASGVVITFVDITERKHAEERQLLLSRELQHRTNNLLAVIQSIAGQSLSGTHSLVEAREALTARLHALANAC